MTTGEAFIEWLDKQDLKKGWMKDPKVMAHMFVDWGDYVKDKYFEYKTNKSKIS